MAQPAPSPAEAGFGAREARELRPPLPVGRANLHAVLPGAADQPNAFDWVDDYFAHIRPRFDVRDDDQLLIVLPNRSVKLNRSGLAILRFLKDGGTARQLLGSIGSAPQRRREVFYFLCDFRSLLNGCLGEGRGRKAVQVVPHALDFHSLPVLSEIAVTYRCNLRCRFCYAACGCKNGSAGASPSQGGRIQGGATLKPLLERAATAQPLPLPPETEHAQAGTWAWHPKELSTSQVLRLLEIIRRDAKVPSVSFTGGEPTLREDIEELIAGARRIGLRPNLITNATLVDAARALRLRDAGLASAQVSLEGPTATVHDGLTGVAGSFESTLAGLDALRRAGIHTHTNTTINAANAEHMEALVDLVAGLGMERMSANLVIPSGSAADLAIQIPYREIGPIVERVRDRARERGIEFMWYSPTPMCLFNPLATGLGDKACAACDGLLSISPRGDVLPCSSYPLPVGNLLDQSFAEVWGSAQAVFFRRKQQAPSQCAGCADFLACAGACPLYWSAMGVGELERRDHVRG